MPIADPEIARTLREFICRELLNDPSYPLRGDTPLVSGGLIDSFMVAHLAVFIEQTFGVHLPDVILLSDEVDTVERIVAIVEAAR
jgi:acyl carrier protein